MRRSSAGSSRAAPAPSCSPTPKFGPTQAGQEYRAQSYRARRPPERLLAWKPGMHLGGRSDVAVLAAGDKRVLRAGEVRVRRLGTRGTLVHKAPGTCGPDILLGF